MHRIIFVGDISRIHRKRTRRMSKERIPLIPMGSPATVMDRWIAESDGQWSPTKEDFDELIAEQDCFEISFREEKKKITILEKENNRLKHELKKERKDRMRLEQEGNQALKKVAILEQQLAESEKQAGELKTENEQLKTVRKVLANSLFLKAGNTACQNNHADLNNNASGDTLDATKDPDDGRKKRRSLVSQLIQGFEAVSTSHKPSRRNDPRRKTCPNFVPNQKD